MEKAYVTSGPAPPQVQAVYIQTEAQPKIAYVTTTQTPPPPPPTPTVVVHRNGATKVFYLGFWLFVYGGMDLAQSLLSNILTILFPRQFFYSWFIGFIVGAIIASVGVSHVPKIVFYVLSSILEMIDGILFVSSQEYSCILAARYLGGAGIGLITVVYIIHSSEVSETNNRGAFTGIEQCGIALGIALEVIYCVAWDESFANVAFTVHGALGIGLSLIALICAIFLRIETPIFYLRRNQEAKALECQQTLSLTNHACVRSFAEAKVYVAEDENESLIQQIGGSVFPFIKLLLHRSFVAFSISFPLIISIQLSSAISLREYSWPFIVWGILRLFGTFVSISALDKLGRKALSILGLFCMAALMLSMAGIYASINNYVIFYYMEQVSNLGMAFQFFAGLYACSSSTYLSESFPLKVKPFFICLVVCIEQLIHIIVILCVSTRVNFLYQYFLAVGIIILLGCIVLAVLMPETRQTTLRQAGQRFRKMYDTKMY